MNTSSRVCAASLSLCLLAACGAEGSEQDLDDSSARDEAIYVKSSTIWPSTSISVCWENSTDSNAAERGWVRDSLVGTWEAVSDIEFTGWEKCTSDSKGIRIRISEAGPHTKGLGKGLDGKKDGMELNFTFNSWSTSCKNRREYCIRAIAVHEFGHALGFAHEQNRSDTPTWCDKEQGGDGDVVIGPWDIDSVMNYCNPNWSGKGILSKADIEGVQLVYGPGLGGFIVNKLSDKCLEPEGESTAAGAKLVLNSCHGGTSQRWYRGQAEDGYVPIIARKSGLCLTVKTSSHSDGAQIEQQKCNGGTNQAWKLGSGETELIAKHSGKCLDLSAQSQADGAKVQQWACHGKDDQKWSMMKE